MQMAAKIVYYGPGLCGKTSNLSYIYAKTAPNSRGEMVSLETESDRTLFFDLLPIEVGTIGGFKTRLQLYTVPGQVFYNTTRKLVLKGVDGLVFVADSQRPMREANIESFESLVQNLDDLGVEFADLPLVLQYNKRDLKNTLAVEELNSDLNPDRAYPFFESEAINGAGVFETLKEITKLTLKKLRRRMVAPHAVPAGPQVPSTQVRPSPTAAPKPTSVSAAALARAAAEGVDGGRDGDRQPLSVKPVEPSRTEVTETLETPVEQPPLPDEQAVSASAEPVSEGPSMELEAVGAEEGGGPFEVAEQESPFAEDEPAAEFEVADELEMAGDQDGSLPSGTTDEESDVMIEFDQTNGEAEAVEPPDMKRVQVSNQMDILAELEGLRKQATMGSFTRRKTDAEQDLDIDALLAGSADTRELRRKVEKALNSDVFRDMRGLQLAIHIQNADGDTIHTLDPVSLQVEKSDQLKKLSLQFTVNLENHQ
jgi:signal recognition particle receptor subunit beta